MHPPDSPEAALAIALAAGVDPRPARAALVAANGRKIRAWARRAWCGAGWRGPLDDYVGAAMLAAWDAALRYDPSTGVPFGGYLALRVRDGDELRRAVRGELAGGLHVSRTEEVPEIQFGPLHATLAPGQVGTAEPAARADDEAPPDPEDFWARVAAVVGPVAAKVLRLRAEENLQPAEIGARVGLSPAKAAACIRNAVIGLREAGIGALVPGE